MVKRLAVKAGRNRFCSMIRLFKHYVPHAVLLLGLLDFVLLLLAGNLAWTLRASQIDMDPGRLGERIVWLG